MTEQQIKQKIVEDQLKEAYLDYSMSVIIGRALPDVKDGLKPVHRRILYAMHEMGLQHNKRFTKCAGIVGDCLKKYHPHGDSSVYDALVRLGQEWNLRYPLVIGQGNWGSIDGDPAGAYRYCVTGDSLIVSEQGLIKIKDLSYKEDIKLKILSKDGKINTASKWFDSGEHETLKITTTKGYELEGSYNHPILIWTKDPIGRPIFEWKKLDEIKEGDIAVLDRTNKLWPRKEIDLTEFYPSIENKKTKVKELPTNLNEDLAYILGALISEGSISENKIEFCNTDENWIKEFIEKWNKLFPDSKLHKFKRKPSSYGKLEYFRLECHSRYTIKFLRNIGLLPVKSGKKTIPRLILQSSKKVLSSFIKAYFEGDGTIVYSRKCMYLGCCSKSKELIKELQIVLLRFGIDSFRRFDDHRNYNLQIRGKLNLLRFFKEIGFISERKNKKLEFILLQYKKETSLYDHVPFISDYIRNLAKSEFATKNNFDRYGNMKTNYKQISSVLLEKTGQNYLPFFEYFLTQNYLFENIISIEKNDIQRVYSIKINSKCHSFISNGFISHNTEAKLHKLAEEMIEDIEKETVDFTPNFDGNLKEPIVLPSKLPNLLINGSTGIAVGMATNIPSHNLLEVIDGVLLILNNPNSEVEDLIKIIKGPDFPTGAIIIGRKGIIDAYKTGKGKLIVRAKTELEDNKIIVKEIPYQVNKSLLIEGIANLVKDGIVEGIKDIRDETDKHGIRVIIDLKKDADPKLVLNQLFKHSSLQTTFGVIMLSLVDNEPKILNLKEIIEKFILHRKQVVTRRTKFELNKAEEKAHILEGLQIALSNIDKVIELIKKSENAEIAKTNLSTNFSLTEKQSLAILEMRLQRLTNLETKKILEDLEKTKKLIEELKSILSSEIKIMDIIKKEVLELKEKYSDKRRTEIVEEEAETIIHEDLIKEETIVVTLTYSGYIKQVPLTTYKQQGRGGKGIQGTSTKDEEDIVKNMVVTSNLNYLMFFTNKGKVFWLKGYEVPEVSRQAKGKAIVNLLNLEENEKVNTVLSVKDYKENQYLVFATKKGVVKKTSLAQYSNVRKSGIIAINLRENDEVVKVILTDNNSELIITSKLGKAVRFHEKDVNEVGRNSTGVRGIKLQEKDEAIGLEIVIPNNTLLTVTEKGFGKRTNLEEYAVIRRGGKGVRNIKVSEKNSFVVSTSIVNDNDEIIIITKKGQIIRLNINQINIIGRNTSGVRLIKLNESDSVANIAKISKE